MENQVLFCAAVRDLAALYTDNEASEETAAAIEKHLLTCSECRRYYKDYRRSGAARSFAAVGGAEEAAATPEGYALLAQRLRRRTALARSLFILAAIVAGAVGFIVAKLPWDSRKTDKKIAKLRQRCKF